MLATDKDTGRLLWRPMQGGTKRWLVAARKDGSALHPLGKSQPLFTAPTRLGGLRFTGTLVGSSPRAWPRITPVPLGERGEKHWHRLLALQRPAHRTLPLIPTRHGSKQCSRIPVVLSWQNKDRLAARPTLLITCLLGSKGPMHHSSACGAPCCYLTT